MERKMTPSSDAMTTADMRLSTLVRLRWLAMTGQTITISIVHFGFGFELPLLYCLSIIALSGVLNFLTLAFYQPSYSVRDYEAGIALGFDAIQLSALLYLTGGLANPFAMFLLAPALVAATTLSLVTTAILAAFVAVLSMLLVFVHHPLPWLPGETLAFPPLYVWGIFIALAVSLFFMCLYARKVSQDSRQLAQALSATELVLAKKHHLSALDGLAAAAAHELGTPLGTISITAKEMSHLISGKETIHHSEISDDIALIKSQTRRCRDILQKLSKMGVENAFPYARSKLSDILREVSKPYEAPDISIDIIMQGEGAEPQCERNAALLYGLGNLIENATDFAKTKVRITANWNADTIDISIEDDGPGFTPEIKRRLGEPYTTTRPAPASQNQSDETIPPHEGMGLGFFIAKTLLERLGATLKVSEKNTLPGASLTLEWQRTASLFAFEQTV
jgi:two-component system sensor histidine kinase RegB